MTINSFSIFYACCKADYNYSTHIFTEDFALMMYENEFKENMWKSGFAYILWLDRFSEVTNSTIC